MRTLICTVTFPDGTRLLVEIAAETPHTPAPLAFFGPVERLGRACAVNTPLGLELFLAQAVERLGATLAVVRTGVYAVEMKSPRRLRGRARCH